MRAAVFATSLALSLTACGGSRSPAPPPASTLTTSASTTPSSSPSPTAPTVPAAAKGSDDKAAGAFARYFIEEALNYAADTGDTKAMKRSSDAGCKSCDYIMKRSSRIYAEGGSIRSKGWWVLGITVDANQPKFQKYIEMRIHQAPQRVVEQAGARPKNYPGGTVFFTMLTAHRGGQWIVMRLDLVR